MTPPRDSPQPGDRFVQVWPPSGDVLEVESVLDDESVAVQRSTGARQVFPIDTLTCGRYWVRESEDA